MDRIKYIGFDMDYTLVGEELKFIINVNTVMWLCFRSVQVTRIRTASLRISSGASRLHWIPKGKLQVYAVGFTYFSVP